MPTAVPLLVAMFLATMLASAQRPAAPLTAAPRHLAPLTAVQWQEDLRVLARELARKHEDLYHTVAKEAFDAAVAALTLRIPALTSTEVQVEMARLVAMVQDGHTELQLLQPAADFRVLPVVFYRYEEGLYVIAAEERFTSLAGGRVMRIGTLDVEEASARVRPLVSGDTAIEALHSGPSYLASPEILFALGITDTPDAVALDVVARDGERRVVTLPAVAARGRLVSMRAAAGVTDPLSSSRPGAYYWFAPFGSTLYFQVNASMNQDGHPSLNDVARELFRQVDAGQIKTLIVDLRNNNGGNLHRQSDLIAGVAARPALHEKGRLFVIAGRRTFSAGLDAVLELKRVAQPIVVGESPRGLPAKPGNRETFVLPNSKLVVDYAQQIDSQAFRSSKGKPMAVDIHVPPRFEDAIVGTDAALAAIAALIQ